MRKTFFAILVIALVAMSVSLVAAQDSTLADVDPTGVVIEYWHEWDGQQQVGIDAVIALFEETNEFGITVEQQPLGSSGNVREQFSTGIISGELPNLVGATFVGDAMSYYLDGVVVPLDDYYNDPVYGFSEEELENLNQQLLDINRPAAEPFNGQLLAWPIGYSANVLSVNLDMLEELGFDGPPTTLEDMREQACAANELTTEDGGDVQGFPLRTSASDLYSFIIANGGYIWEDGQYNFTNDGTIEVLQFFADLYADGCAYIPDGPFVNTADFAFGLNPFAVGSSVGIPFIRGDIEDSGSGIENWINTSVPWAEGNRTVQAYLRSMGLVVATPEEQLATWLFLKFMSSPEAQVIWTEAATYFPYTQAGLDGLSDDFITNNPQFDSMRQLLVSGEVNLWSSPVHIGDTQVGEVVEEMIVAITTGSADVMEAAQEAEELANEILEEAAMG